MARKLFEEGLPEDVKEVIRKDGELEKKLFKEDHPGVDVETVEKEVKMMKIGTDNARV